jgi:hypothetical protein
MRYDIIEGVPAIKSRTLLAEFQAAGGKFEWHETSDQICHATFTHPVHYPRPFEVTKTYEEFDKKGVIYGFDGKIKRNWRTAASQMLIARTVSYAINAIMPGIAMGIPVTEEVDNVEAASTEEPRKASTLNQQLQARLTKSEPSAVVDVESEPDSIAVEPEAKPNPNPSPVPAERKAQTEWGAFISKCVAIYNSELDLYSAQYPDRQDLKKHMSPIQVINLTAKTIAGDTNALKSHGKHDSTKVAKLLQRVWTETQDVIPEIVYEYFDKQLSDLGFTTNMYQRMMIDKSIIEAAPIANDSDAFQEGRE